MNLFLEYMGNKGLDLFSNKLKEFLDEMKLQRILLQCFEIVKDFEKERGTNVDGFNIEKDKIMKVSSESIRPNLSKEKLMNNIEYLLKDLINIDGNKDIIKDEICSCYLKRAQKEMLELYHIHEDIEYINDELEKSINLQNKHMEKTCDIQRQISKLMNASIPVYFIPELELSRFFCYIVLSISCHVEVNQDNKIIDEEDRELFEDIKAQLEEDLDLGFQWVFFEKDYMPCAGINFDIPINQNQLKAFLNIIDEEFYKNGIRIYGVLTHL